MKNVQELRDELLSNIPEIKSGNLPIKEAEAIANHAGKVNQTVLLELKYAELRKEKADIPFLNGGNMQLAENGVSQLES